MLNTLGVRLRDLRKAAKLSQKELSARIGVSRSLLSRIECGKAESSVSLVVKIVRELNLPRQYASFLMLEAPSDLSNEALFNAMSDLITELAFCVVRANTCVDVQNGDYIADMLRGLIE